MFISFYAVHILIVFCLMSRLLQINLDVHLECMSIVTDATQNQNGADLTLNWGVETMIDLTLTGESKL